MREAAFAVVLHASDDDAGRVALQLVVAIPQQMPPHVAVDGVGVSQLFGNGERVVLVHIHGIVMVAEDGHHPVGGLQLREQVLALIDLIDTDVLQVAGEDDEIGVLGIDAVDGAPQVALGHGAYVGVAELHDAVAVEGRRQVGTAEHLLSDHQLLRTDIAAIGPPEATDESDENCDKA